MVAVLMDFARSVKTMDKETLAIISIAVGIMILSLFYNSPTHLTRLTQDVPAWEYFNFLLCLFAQTIFLLFVGLVIIGMASQIKRRKQNGTTERAL